MRHLNGNAMDEIWDVLRPWTRRQQLIVGLLAATWWQLASMAWDVIRWTVLR